jgi:branched-chain amino acid transport system substrate-binding protein
MRSLSKSIARRTILKATLAAGAAQFAAPFIIPARAADTVKFGLNNPLTGTYAEYGKNEQIGCELAIDQINAKGGILGRKAELLVEDSTSADTGIAVQKARKLLERDKVNFLLGNVNSAMALAIAQVANELKTLHIVTGGHTDAVTGTDCHWNVFRVCNTTRMEANAVAKVLYNKYGKRWYFITPDYAFGHTLQEGLEAALKKLGGSVVGGDLTPLGTTDFSANLIKAQSANPDVLILLVAGGDMIACIKQALQFGLDKRLHIAGAQQELENLVGLPPNARIGTWVFEWYWKQPNVPHVAEFVAAMKQKNGGKAVTARHWFGFVGLWTCALVANQEKTLDAAKLAKALEGFKLPPEVALMPNSPYYRAGDHQLMPSLYVGHAVEQGSTPDDLFQVDEVVKGDDVAPPVDQTGCHLTWPA